VDSNDTTYTNIDKNEKAFMDKYRQGKTDQVSHDTFNDILKRAHGGENVRNELKTFLKTVSPELKKQYSEFYKNKTAVTTGSVKTDNVITASTTPTTANKKGSESVR